MCGCSTVIGVAKSVGFIMREHARVNEGARERDSSVRLFKDFECILRRNFPTWQPNLQSNNPHRRIPLFIKGAAGECVYTQMYVYLFLEYIVNIYVCTSLCVGVHIDIVGVVVTRIDLFMFIK